MGEFRFYIDIEDSAGNRLGSGPITEASYWESIDRIDRAGSIAFAVPATIENAAVIQKKRVARCHGLLGETWTELGAGVIDNISRTRGADGKVQLQVSGDDLLRELNYRTAKTLKLESSGSPISHSAAVAAIAAYAPAGWTFTADVSPPNDLIYGRFNGEKVLAAAINVAAKSKNHFYRGTGRALVFASTFSDSGIRAIEAGPGNLVAETCAITSITETIDTFEYVNRIYPRGSGNGDVQLTLAATTRSAPAGYTLDKVNNYIQYDAGVVSYGVIEEELAFREVGPVSNTDADLVSAANMLFDVTLEELTRRSVEMEQATYDVGLAQCSVRLRPLQTIRTICYDEDAGLDIDDDLNILEARNRVDATGVYATGLVVSSADRWPESDDDLVAGSIAQGNIYQALPQLNANAYVTAYTKLVDVDNIAAFRFRFGDEVTQLQQVLFEFQLLPFESTVKSVGGTTSGSGAIPTGGPSTNDTGSGGNNETGSGGPTSTGETTPTIGTSTPTIGTTTPTIGTTTPTIGSATPAIGSATPAIGQKELETEAPTGGDIEASGGHVHHINITLGGTVTYPIGYGAAGTAGGLVSTAPGASHQYVTTEKGNHTHEIDPHTHSIDPHTHTIAEHNHTISGHTHGMSGHTHSMSGHTHGMSGHTHSMSGHTHSLPGHTHTMSAHTHSMAAHTHSLNNHTHDLSESISAVYGIFRDDTDHVFSLDELSYRVNGGPWADLSGATDAGDGWYQLDITSQVQDSTTFRPNQTNNLLEIQTPVAALSISQWLGAATSMTITTTTAHGLEEDDPVVVAGAETGSSGSNVNGTYTVASVLNTTQITVETYTGTNPDLGGAGGTVTLDKRATIDAQLSVRNIIQAIAYV